jgi:hypothetical protein
MFMHKTILRFEGVLFFILSTVAYWYFGFKIWIFISLFFVPDISILAYRFKLENANNYYNFAHTYFIPVFLVLISYIVGINWLFMISLIWISHIGFDRMLGFGLKISSFKDTHLGRI